MSARNQWARELKAGTRTRTTFDDLWRRACQEAADAEQAEVRHWAVRRTAELTAKQIPAVRPLAESCPALAKWAGDLIAGRAVHPALAQAAAFEAVALECETAGKPELGAHARERAEQIIGDATGEGAAA